MCARCELAICVQGSEIGSLGRRVGKCVSAAAWPLFVYQPEQCA